MKKGLSRTALVALLGASLALGACTQAPAENKNANANANANAAVQTETKDSTQEAVSLAQWEGVWNDMGAYLELPEVQDAYKSLAEKDKTTPEEAKEAYLKKRACDFGGMEIHADHVHFLKDGKDPSSVISEASYTYTGDEKTTLGDHELTWHIFEGEGDYPVLALMEVHHEGDLVHFHFRYGKTKDEIFQKDGWFPTMVDPNSTTEQIIGEIAE